eukprot:CAMPEP_0113940310 /NCGR_PEP_ID=MMETSP1339-20121228/6471_1 /TAXON_ID=94617 /ORGANISM="Fibrocapsa japonica" /LENGTH=143 /DNA_ID=CAMNT_0000944105 /DNA_START=153 /DNA_END=584 /DNA_ORIENTATION=+ /assembly_acc=CAM_ASM_000762
MGMPKDTTFIQVKIRANLILSQEDFTLEFTETLISFVCLAVRRCAIPDLETHEQRLRMAHLTHGSSVKIADVMVRMARRARAVRRKERNAKSKFKAAMTIARQPSMSTSHLSKSHGSAIQAERLRNTRIAMKLASRAKSELFA